MGGGVFFVAGAAAREVRVAELKSNFVASVSHDLEDAAGADSALRRNARARTRAQCRARAGVLPGHQRRGAQADAPDREHPGFLEDGSRPAARTASRRPTSASSRGRWSSAMGSQFTQGHFSVRTTVDPALPRVLIDCDAVEQALENVLTNAMKYSGESRDHRRPRRPVERARVRAASPITASASRGASRNASSASSIASTAVWAAVRRDAVSAWPSSITPCAATAGSSTSTASPTTAARFTLHFPIPAGAAAEGEVHEADSGDRGRAADVARPA